jgi:hypothetical protein
VWVAERRTACRTHWMGSLAAWVCRTCEWSACHASTSWRRLEQARLVTNLRCAHVMQHTNCKCLAEVMVTVWPGNTVQPRLVHAFTAKCELTMLCPPTYTTPCIFLHDGHRFVWPPEAVTAGFAGEEDEWVRVSDSTPGHSLGSCFTYKV